MGEALFPHKPPCPWITFLILLYEIKNFSKHKISPKMGGSVLPPLTLTNRKRFVTPHAQVSHVISKIRFGVWG